jgi:hypothetical protein
MPDFNIGKIADYLGKYKDQLDVLYEWEVNNTQKLAEIGVANETEIAELKYSDLSHFQKTQRLKDILSKALDNCPIDSPKFERIALWIIRDWGGIHNGSDSDTIKCVKAFLRADKPAFDRIASSSKVGGFMPQTQTQRIIYDSRVAYTMNWIILSENAGNKFFPIPEGRNSKMQAFNLDVLIRLKFLDIYRPDKTRGWKYGRYISTKDREIFIPKADAYFELNRLVGQVNELLWNDDNTRRREPFYTEMLLFAIADRGVFEDITERTRIEIR